VRRVYTSCVSAILTACSGSASAWAAPISASPEPAVTACVVRGPDRDPETAASPPQADSITIAGDEVTLCWNLRPVRSCWSIDVASKSFVPQTVTDAPRHDAPRFVQRSHATATPRADGTILLCAPAGSPCKSFANPRPTPQLEWAGVSDDLSTVAVPDDEKLRIYDAATARVRATIKRWPDSPMPGGFSYAPIFASPNRMIVWNSWTPVSEQGRIFDMSGRQLAIIGNKGFSAIEPNLNSWLVQGTEWVTSGDVNTLVTVDVEHPKITSTYDISELLAQPRPPRDSDSHVLDVLAVAGNAKRLIIVTGENPFTIGIVDRATKKVVKLQPAICSGR
jgi:hypothetical protein